MKTPDRITTLIKEARARKAMTQIDVGVACGYSGEVAQVTVARWEAGTRPVPMDKLRTLSKVLSLKIGDLIP